MSDDESWPTSLPNYRVDRLDDTPRWSGYLGTDTLDGIAERVTRIVAPGRSFVITRTDSFAPARVETGLTLFVSSESIGDEPIRAWTAEYGCGFRVRMGPGICGFSAITEWPLGAGATYKAMTGSETKAVAEGSLGYDPQIEWTWVALVGGIDGPRPGDRITIRRRNEHGYQQIIDVISCDTAWTQRWERDALVADSIADALDKPDPSEYDPGASLDRTAAAEAAAAVRQVAADVRRWRHSLTDGEVYPAVDGKYL